MIYDLSNALDEMKFKDRMKRLWNEHKQGKRIIVELSEKKQRTISQNSYLHLILSYFACECGLQLDYVKRYYFKAYVNADLFIVEQEDKLLGKKVKSLRSTADLTKEEMQLAISRFLNWSAQEAEIPLPEPEQKEVLREIEIEVERNKMYNYD